MQTLKLIFCCFVGLCLFYVPASAADRSKLIAFMNITGFDKQLESIRLSAETAPLMVGIEVEQFGESWTLLADQLFDPETIKEEALDILSETLSNETLQFGAGFYASSLGVRLVEAENESHFADDEEKQEQGEILAAQLRAEESQKIEYFIDMMDSIGGLEQSLRSFRELQLQFLLTAMQSGLVDYQISEDDLRAMLKSQDAEIASTYLDNMLAANAYTYRDFSDEDILEYSKALADPRMQELYELMNAVTHTIMIDRYKTLAFRLVDLRPGEIL